MVKGLSYRAHLLPVLLWAGWYRAPLRRRPWACPEKDRQHLSVELPRSWALSVHSGFRLLLCGVLEASGDHPFISHALGARNCADPKRVLQDTGQGGTSDTCFFW